MNRSFRPSSFLSIALAALIVLNLLYFIRKFGYINQPVIISHDISDHGAPDSKPAGAVAGGATTTVLQWKTATVTDKPLPIPPAATDSPASRHGQIGKLPSEYFHDDVDEKWCEDRYGRAYLETIAKNARPYCTPSSRSQLDCLHSIMDGERRRDSFCIARNVAFDKGRFNIDCDTRDPAEPDLEGLPYLNEFLPYWYKTGPRVLFDDFTRFPPGATAAFDAHACDSPTTQRDDSYKVLIKREGGTNYWHTLMEILSFYFSVDALQMAIDKKTGKPYLSPEDTSKIQVVIADTHDNLAYRDLWGYFSDRPILNLSNYSKSDTPACLNNLIIPLPGASNPLWQGDWKPRSCDHSLLVDTVRSRILNRLSISTDRDFSHPVNVTFIDRRGSRKLTNSRELINTLKKAYPSVHVNVVDMAPLTLRQQLDIIVRTDVLVGVHGAGHTHGFFLPSQSSVVEILPDDLAHRGFRNLASLRGLRYFSGHAPMTPKPNAKEKGDWHAEDVVYDKKAFMKLMAAAIQSVAHRGLLDSDSDA
ncbi:EGF domain-specific O-linked N-acetylglucosamine transferase [Drechslerella dactyloides]|uniref:EGF domain-specific O-linked N-acetylglucosamine transferase n=1 Tax=Drechslerella dactyloides TaxID=74499 RepID=A0AAD6NMH9_DREDA|nr:EGF domain-specific O-linked N-acetylglucosamine transferase [Drechslerella dactyloides]